MVPPPEMPPAHGVRWGERAGRASGPHARSLSSVPGSEQTALLASHPHRRLKQSPGVSNSSGLEGLCLWCCDSPSLSDIPAPMLRLLVTLHPRGGCNRAVRRVCWAWSLACFVGQMRRETVCYAPHELTGLVSYFGTRGLISKALL